jgi:hypothetical protein
MNAHIVTLQNENGAWIYAHPDAKTADDAARELATQEADSMTRNREGSFSWMKRASSDGYDSYIVYEDKGEGVEGAIDRAEAYVDVYCVPYGTAINVG